MNDRAVGKPSTQALGAGWKEVYLGGSVAEEEALIGSFVSEINTIQDRLKARKAPQVLRAQHAKILAGVTNAEFRIAADVPDDLRIGLFQPGMTYPATVRFSNASGGVQPDA